MKNQIDWTQLYCTTCKEGFSTLATKEHADHFTIPMQWKKTQEVA